MGFFNRGAYHGRPDVNATGQLPQGEKYSRWQVAGVWGPEGEVLRPSTIVVEVEHPDEPERRTKNIGDVLNLTRSEAEVVGKHVVLTPVTE